MNEPLETMLIRLYNIHQTIKSQVRVGRDGEKERPLRVTSERTAGGQQTF